MKAAPVFGPPWDNATWWACLRAWWRDEATHPGGWVDTHHEHAHVRLYFAQLANPSIVRLGLSLYAEHATAEDRLFSRRYRSFRDWFAEQASLVTMPQLDQLYENVYLREVYLLFYDRYGCEEMQVLYVNPARRPAKVCLEVPYTLLVLLMLLPREEHDALLWELYTLEQEWLLHRPFSYVFQAVNAAQESVDFTLQT